MANGNTERALGKVGKVEHYEEKEKMALVKKQKDHQLRRVFMNSFTKYWLSICRDPCSMDTDVLETLPSWNPQSSRGADRSAQSCDIGHLLVMRAVEEKPVKKISDGINKADDSEEMALEV